MSLGTSQTIALDFIKKSYVSISGEQYDTETRNVIIRCYSNGEKMPLQSTYTVDLLATTPASKHYLFKNIGTISDNEITFVLPTSLLVEAGRTVIGLSVYNGEERLSSATFYLVVHNAVYTDDEILADDTKSAINQLTGELQEYATMSLENSRLSKSWAIGDTFDDEGNPVREDQDVNNSKYWASDYKDHKDGLVTDISYTSTDGKFLITFMSGSTKVIDTDIEKMAVNFDYDETRQVLILILEDGTKKEIDFSAFITEAEYENSDTITFSVDQSTHKVSAIVKPNSIKEEQLEINYLTNIKAESTAAKSYAVGGTGTRTGEDTDNAKYYYEQTSISESNANASELAAKASEENAKTSETNAKTSETNAATSETNAKTSETNAATSETNAKASETASATSEANAKTSESNAKTSETNSKASETAAKTSETNAATSETNAKDSEDAAATSEANAKTSETNAKASETNIKASELAVKASETNAKTSETNAKTSETNAKTSETNAAKSESNAAASETNAKAYNQYAQSYAVGGTSTRAEEDSDNAKYYYNQAKSAATTATTGATNSSASAKLSQSYAVGGTNSRSGEDTDNAKYYASKAQEVVDDAVEVASAAIIEATADYTKKTISYAVGGTDYRPGEDTDNAKYYYEQTKYIENNLSGILRQKGSVTFAQLKSIASSDKVVGDLYNITEQFTSDNTFQDGGGYVYPKGTNVYWDSVGFWDCLAGPEVLTVDGSTGIIDLTTKYVQLDNEATTTEIEALFN